MTVNVFAVPVFFVVFRETLETAVIVSVLLAFLKQTLDGPNRDRAVYKKLVKQVMRSSKTSVEFSNMFVGLVWDRCRSSHLLDHRWWFDRCLLWPGQRQMGQHRVLLGRFLRRLCFPRHQHPGCCSPPRL